MRCYFCGAAAAVLLSITRMVKVSVAACGSCADEVS